MKAIVLLFKDDSSDNENFAYQNFKTVKISIEGKPNQVYSRDVTKNCLYVEAHRLFSNKMKFDQNITVHDFFKDSFCVTIDLRLSEDNQSIYGSGRKVVNTQSGILLESTKSAATTKDHAMYVFVVSDRLINFINNDLQSIQY